MAAMVAPVGYSWQFEPAFNVPNRLVHAVEAPVQTLQEAMFCFVATGNRQAALEQYSRCEQALRETYQSLHVSTTVKYSVVEKGKWRI
jgi:hypothetical protein